MFNNLHWFLRPLVARPMFFRRRRLIGVCTAIVCTITPDKATQLQAHDIFGWLMMPLGLGLLAFQLWCLSRLVIRTTRATPDRDPMGYGLGVRPAMA